MLLCWAHRSYNLLFSMVFLKTPNRTALAECFRPKKQASYVQYIAARSKFLKSKPEEKLLCSTLQPPSPKSSSSLSLLFFLVKKCDWEKWHLELQENTWNILNIHKYTHILGPYHFSIFFIFFYGFSDLCEISLSTSPFWTTGCSYWVGCITVRCHSRR